MNITTDNFRKHTSKNILQRFLINNFYKQLLGIAKSLSPYSILDVGSGEGFTLAQLQGEKIGNKLEGLEYSEEAIKLGKQMFPELNLRQGDIYHMPYADNAFDLIICSEVLEHLENPDQALQELIRVSKKYCLFSVPNEPWFMLANFLRGKNVSRWGNDIEHINHWSSQKFANFVGMKLKVLKMKTPFPWTILLAEKNSLQN